MTLAIRVSAPALQMCFGTMSCPPGSGPPGSAAIRATRTPAVKPKRRSRVAVTGLAVRCPPSAVRRPSSLARPAPSCGGRCCGIPPPAEIGARACRCRHRARDRVEFGNPGCRTRAGRDVELGLAGALMPGAGVAHRAIHARRAMPEAAWGAWRGETQAIVLNHAPARGADDSRRLTRSPRTVRAHVRHPPGVPAQGARRLRHHHDGRGEPLWGRARPRGVQRGVRGARGRARPRIRALHRPGARRHRVRAPRAHRRARPLRALRAQGVAEPGACLDRSLAGCLSPTYLARTTFAAASFSDDQVEDVALLATTCRPGCWLH